MEIFAVGQFRINFRENSSYWWLIGERALFILGVYGVQAFAQYYLQDVLRVPDPPKQTGDLLAVLTISLVVLVLIGGWLTDKYGAKRILSIGTFIASAGMLLMLFATDIRGLYDLWQYPRRWDRTLPHFQLGTGKHSRCLKREFGKYLGLTNLATAGSGALACLEGPALDWLNAAHPGAWIGYKSLFIFGALCIFLSTFLLQKISENPSR